MPDFPAHDTALAKPVRARGKAKKHSNTELEAMTSPDVLRAAMKDADSDWKKNAPRAVKTILEAKEQAP